MSDLLSVQEALQRILERFSAVSTTSSPLERSLGLILAEDIYSNIDQPPFTNSAMDGFAVVSADTAGASAAQPVHLKVVMDIPAGSLAQGPIVPGQAARIMTGGIVPEGADAIVPIEDTSLGRNTTSAPAPLEITILKPATNGAFLRPKGQDLLSGELVLKAGRRLMPQDLGMLASLGYACVPVYRKPKIALLSSGNELVSPSEPLPPGKIRDTNSYTLGALVEGAGAELIRLGVVKDDPEMIRERLELAVERTVDLILTSAGVSVGAFDYVREVIERNGELTFWKVNIRPGKPLAFGSFHGIPLIGLPGNPVSAYIGFQVFVSPVLQRLTGQAGILRPRLKVAIDQPIESDGRESYLRAVLFEKCGKITATLAGHQGSGNLYSLIKANALLVIPGGITSLPAGAELEAWLLDEYWLDNEKA
jgi:molybdopterin molybdotransferase